MKNAFNIDKYEVLVIFALLAYGWVYFQMNLLK